MATADSNSDDGLVPLVPVDRPDSHRDGERHDHPGGEGVSNVVPVRRVKVRAPRGWLIVSFGILSVISAVGVIGTMVVSNRYPPMKVLLPVGIVVGVIFGCLACSYARKDLKDIDVGTMSFEGRSQTLTGFITGIIGIILNILTMCACGGHLLLNFWLMNIRY